MLEIYTPGTKEWKRAEFLRGVAIALAADALLAAGFIICAGAISMDILWFGVYVIGITQFVVILPLSAVYSAQIERLQGLFFTAFAIFLINAGICGAMAWSLAHP